jgi:hypothetical protein
MAPAESSGLWRRQAFGEALRERMKTLAVEEKNFEPPGAEDGAEVQKTQRFHPQIISRKIMDPGIDEKNGPAGEIWHGDEKKKMLSLKFRGTMAS